MMHLLDVHRSVAQARLREMVSFRADFLAGTLAVLTQQIINLVFLSILFRHTSMIGGYGYSESVLLFGLAMSVQSLSHIWFEGLHIIGPRHIERGELDLLLIRPGHPLLHILSSHFQISGILPFLLGVTISVVALFHHAHAAFPLALFCLPFILFSGTLVIGGIILLAASLTFLFRRIRAIRRTVQSFEDTLFYPLDVFSPALQTFLLTILPFGWAAFGPSRFFLTGEIGWLLASLVAGPFFAVLGIALFNTLLPSYESTGT